MTTYQEKLKDPRWQKKRLEVLERDNWSCQICSGTEETLHVHHRRYVAGRSPWEYHNDDLVSLCEDCHEHERECRKEYESQLLEVLKNKFFADDLSILVDGFFKMEPPFGSEVMADVLRWVLPNKNIHMELFDRYLEYKLSKKKVA